MVAIRKELRNRSTESVTTYLKLSALSARRIHAPQSAIFRTVQNHALTIPRTTETESCTGTQRGRRTTGCRNAFQFPVRKKSDVAAIRRPKRRAWVVGSFQYSEFRRIQRPDV